MLAHEFRAVRHLAARVLAVMGRLSSVVVMSSIVDKVLPVLSSPEPIKRQGAMEAVACIVDSLNTQVIPFAVLLAVPVLGELSCPIFFDLISQILEMRLYY
jgi:TATA-binding protein-associated factor